MATNHRMTGAERCLAVLRGEIPDRVPVSTYELVGWDSTAWENREPSYARLMEAVRRDTDCLYRWGPEWPKRGLGYFLTATEEVTAEQQVRQEGADQKTRHLIHTPKGDLVGRTSVRQGLHTTWTEEHFVKTAEDIERVLSIPYVRQGPPDCADLLRARAELGDRGIILADVGDAICQVAPLFDFGEFTVLALTEPKTTRRLLDFFHRRIMDRLEMQLQAGVGPLWRLVGAEYATPPYLPPELFAEYVVPYDREMAELIHRHGGYARLHCHGRIARVVEHILATGVDSIDPVEPPPQGDIEFAEAKRRLGGRLTLMGNLELAMLETAGAGQVRAEVRKTMAAGKPGGRFVLMPTAAPIDVPLKPQTEENYLAFIQTARELGEY